MPRVLVVEDDAFIRIDVALMIEQVGHTVIEAENADVAIKLMEAEPPEILVTDVEMPGSMDGLALAAVVAKRWPAVRIVIASGLTTLRKAAMPVGTRYLAKPCSSFALAAAVGSCSSGAAAAKLG